DGGYTGSNFAADVYTNLKATVQVAKRNELHKFEVLPQRWIIERSFSWLDKCRRLWKNCKRQLNTSRQMVILAFLVLLLKRF
ncbi:transposase, partial [Lactiplantibacillus argentoratensis]|uniref:transposase n=1 Tax=Lactiplantibacillus argentoratensis TaxID=271881 RepID=UPI001D064B37